jgi:hypothetical protein
MNGLKVRIIFTFLLFTTYTAAQHQSSEDTWARYRPDRLSSIIKAHSNPAEARDKGVGLGSDPVRARVTYTGTSRPILSAQSATDLWITLIGPDKDFKVDFPAEPKFDEFRGKATMGKAGPLIRRYYAFTDTLLLVISFQDLDYKPNNPFANSIAPTYEQKIKEAAKRGRWKIISIQRLSNSIAELESWDRSVKPEGYVHTISHTVVRNGQAYDLQCRSTFIGHEVDRAVCRRFFNSFRVIGPPQ